MRSPKWLAWLGPLLLLATTLGCTSDSQSNPNITADAGPVDPAYLNVVHAVPDVDAIDLYVDQQKTASALAYRKSTLNLKITPAAHVVELRPAGSSASDPALLTANLTLQPGSKTLLMALGRAKEAAGPTKLQLVAVPVGTPDAKSVKVRLLNAAPSAPALDLAAGNNVVAGGASFASASGFGSVALLPAASKLGLRFAKMNEDLAYVTLPAMATPGAVLTVIALGELSPVSQDRHFLAASVLDEGSGYMIDLPLQINDTGAPGSLIVVHAAPGAATVDVVDKLGSKLVSSLAFQNASPLVELPAGVHLVSLRDSLTSSQLLAVNLRLLPGLAYTVLVHGTDAISGQPPVQLSGLLRPEAGQSSWRLVNALIDDPMLTAVVAGKQLVDGLGFAQGSRVLPTALPAKTLALRNATKPTQGWDAAVPQPVLDATADQLVTVVATGTFSTPMRPPVVLAVIDNTATAAMAATVLTLTIAPAAMMVAPPPGP